MARGPGSRRSAQNISVNYYHSPLFGSSYIGRFDTIFNWTHLISAFGGFDTAEFDVAANQQAMEDWFENGLGRMIRAFDEAGVLIWEGFVDKVTVTDAGLEVTRGPLLDSGNRVDLWYSAFDFEAGNNPVPGIRKNTATADNIDAQQKYGIVYKILSASGVSDVGAIQLRDTYLEENTEPVTSSSFSFMPSVPSLIISCKGYFHWLGNFPYTRLSPGFPTVSEKIIDLLEADPNGYISTDFSSIDENGIPVPWWENDSQAAVAILKGLVAMGDVDENRWLFGIYEDRKAYYYQAPSTVEYHLHLHDQTRSVYQHGSDHIVMPWSVRPGRWIKFQDFLPGLQENEENLRNDPRNMFLESVEFTSPNQLGLTGGKISKLDQKIARMGLSGIAA